MKEYTVRDPRKGGRRTSTSSYGTTGRFGHDSSKFYGARLYDGLRKTKTVNSQETPDSYRRSLIGYSAGAANLWANCRIAGVHLMVTSPPYNVGKDYDEDLSLEEYRAFLDQGVEEKLIEC